MTTPISSPGNVYQFLFADYILALSKWFSSFRTFKQIYDPKTGEYNDEIPVVIYGQPSAAYRTLTKDLNTINGKPRLPVISFFALNFTRVKERQNPYARYTSNWMKNELLEEGDYASQSRAPQVWKITYNVSIWTNNNKSRDDLISKIVRRFNTSLTLSYFPDPVTYPHHYIWMPFSMEEDITDSTEFEQLDETDTRDLIRTDFILTGESVLPLETKFYKAIKSVGIEVLESKIKTGDPDGQYRIDVISKKDEPLHFIVNSTEKL